MDKMEPSFWENRWREGKTAFHEGAVNVHLARHFPALKLDPGARVFLPLCGKSVDIDWLLARGCRVSGSELSKEAVVAVFERLEVTPDIERVRDLHRYASNGLVVWQGDFFKLRNTDLGPVEAVYDRAALVAMPPSMRDSYVGHLRRLCGPVPQLLVTYDYDQARMDGPPFAVPERDMRAQYEDAFEIDPLSSVDIYGALADRCSGQEQSWCLRPALD
ncbi:thiopurine S-methyltransferase [Roseibium sp. MMSF_3412]|uniref:thiopurine S-methyltransferase n=1 Tax=Roseibium sp. MMSF_3412 TaxID=3046712 RepID=UPI00273FCE9D|nr:thiopurine S-methyltransferase [Roseibium sp. MMSF_3412]